MWSAWKRGGLWEIGTVGKQRAFLARGQIKRNRVYATAKRPVRAKSVVKKTVKVVEIDLDESDDENRGVSEEITKGKTSPETAVQSKPASVEKPVVESQELGRYQTTVQRGPAEWYRANVGAATENVGAKDLEHGVEQTSLEMSDAVRYQESGGGESGGVWVTPKAKKTVRKRSGMT
ncbi:hypothetical protein KFL_010420020 [Klebsormidium nitens]|uniref:Uncharacterized protein n=1 Tax=Klebsormidium nitens TaxID=105231 RepID=A0A1Y1IPF2_KLENI|nr:hypothetical protein KFL_010420020 [Klebsormidium nitens]|eukprot:GAQ92533.1 hypothetical protein KFL_010420020 [Klebsormidium nitens]